MHRELKSMEQKDYWGAIRSALIGIGAGIVVLSLGALMAVRMAHPEGVMKAISFTALIMGALIGGILQGRDGVSMGMLCLSAGIYGSLPWIVSIVIGGLDRFWIRAAVYILMMLVFILVGWLTPSRRPKRKYRYK